jgi:hypothetical protein
MKIAITGHTAGIGQAFAEFLSSRGHDIIGISKRDGNNIRVIPKVVEMIDHCDMWINNAQSGYAQTELLYKICERWQGQRKMIWLISSMMTRSSGIPDISGLGQTVIAEYKNQKRALEDAFLELKSIKGAPQMCLIRPGSVATQPGKTADIDSADVNKWVISICEFYILCRENNLWPEEISLGFKKNSLTL